jgi:hypothetical protein
MFPLLMLFFGWGSRIRTCASRSQSPLPYRLAIPHRLYSLASPLRKKLFTITRKHFHAITFSQLFINSYLTKVSE